MLDLAGSDADDFFEDIGHSNDARAELKKHLVGVLKLSEEEIAQRKAAAESAAKAGGNNNLIIVILVILAAIAYGYYQQKQT